MPTPESDQDRSAFELSKRIKIAHGSWILTSLIPLACVFVDNWVQRAMLLSIYLVGYLVYTSAMMVTCAIIVGVDDIGLRLKR